MTHPRIISLPKKTIQFLNTSQIVLKSSSVVKELVENAVDAGATCIDVKLENFGLDLIEVRDDGVGISPDDSKLMGNPHCTSKLRETADLDELRTYGFRGEAFHAICCLANVSVTTRQKGEECGRLVQYDSQGHVKDIKACPAKQGTTVGVRNLFFNLPVRRQQASATRRKKEDLREVELMLMAFGIIRPELRITLRHNYNQIRCKNRCSDVSSCLAQIFGFSVAKNLTRLKSVGELNEASVELFIPNPRCLHMPEMATTSSDKFFVFINERPVDFSRMTKVVKDYAAKHLREARKFPVGVVIVQVPPSDVDVNLEPNKTKVLLKNEEEILSIAKSLLASFEELAVQPTSKEENFIDMNTAARMARSVSQAYAEESGSEPPNPQKPPATSPPKFGSGNPPSRFERVEGTSSLSSTNPPLEENAIDVINSRNPHLRFDEPALNLDSLRSHDFIGAQPVTASGDITTYQPEAAPAVQPSIRGNSLPKPNSTDISLKRKDVSRIPPLEGLEAKRSKGPRDIHFVNIPDSVIESARFVQQTNTSYESGGNSSRAAINTFLNQFEPLVESGTVSNHESTYFDLTSACVRNPNFSGGNLPSEESHYGGLNPLRGHSEDSGDSRDTRVGDLCAHGGTDVDSRIPVVDRIHNPEGITTHLSLEFEHPDVAVVGENANTDGRKNISGVSFSEWSRGVALGPGVKPFEIFTVDFTKGRKKTGTGHVKNTSLAQSETPSYAKQSSESRGSSLDRRQETGYQNFCAEMRPKVLGEFPGADFVLVGRLLRDRWKDLSPDEKAKFENKAKQANKSNHVRNDGIATPPPPPENKSEAQTSKCPKDLQSSMESKLLSVTLDEISEKLARGIQHETHNVVIGPLSGYSCWTVVMGNTIGIMNPERVGEMKYFQKLMETVELQAEEMTREVVFARTDCTESVWKGVESLRTTGTGNMKARVTDERLVANGIQSNFIRGDCHLEDRLVITSMPKDIPFFSQKDVAEILTKIGNSCSVSESRPLKIKHYLQGEAVRRIRSDSPEDRFSREMVDELLTYLVEELRDLDVCFHDRPLFTPLVNIFEGSL